MDLAETVVEGLVDTGCSHKVVGHREVVRTFVVAEEAAAVVLDCTALVVEVVVGEEEAHQTDWLHKQLPEIRVEGEEVALVAHTGDCSLVAAGAVIETLWEEAVDSGTVAVAAVVAVVVVPRVHLPDSSQLCWLLHNEVKKPEVWQRNCPDEEYAAEMLLVDVEDGVVVHRVVSETVGPVERTVFAAAVVEVVVVALLWSGVAVVVFVAAEPVELLPELTVHFVHVFVEVGMTRTVVKEVAFRDRKAEVPGYIEAALEVLVPAGK